MYKAFPNSTATVPNNLHFPYLCGGKVYEFEVNEFMSANRFSPIQALFY